MKRYLLLCMFAIVACISLFAQQTAYEKKVEEICIKYYCLGKYGYNGGLDMSDALSMSMYGAEAAALLSLSNYAIQVDAVQGEKWIKSFKKELENATSLMTEADFYKIYLSSQYGRLMNQVKESWGEKYTKDEFETQAQFEARVKKDATKDYDRICTTVLVRLNSTLSIQFIPKKYDADRAAYNIEIVETFQITPGKEESNKYETWIPMESSLARVYKGDLIDSESIISVDWVTVGNDIHAQNVSYYGVRGSKMEYKANLANADLLVFPYDKLKDTYPIIPGYIWKSTDLKDYYSEYNNQVISMVDEYNKKIAKNKYFVSTRSDYYWFEDNQYSLPIDDKYDEEALINDMEKAKRFMAKDYADLLKTMEKECREYAPLQYIEAYKSEHPEFNAAFETLSEDYKCYEYRREQLAFFVIDNKTPSVEKCYSKYIYLFNSDKEFEQFYAEVEDFIGEVARREQLFQQYELINKNLPKDGSLSFKGALDGKSPEIVEYVNLLSSLKIVELWYNTTLETIFSSDAKMVKEYSKVADKFENKAEFFDAYVSSDYKTILKNKKK